MKPSNRPVVLVAGGAGVVGSGIVKEFLRNNYLVVVPSRRSEALSKLVQEIPHEHQANLVTISRLSAHSINTPHEMFEVNSAVNLLDEWVLYIKTVIMEKFGRLDHVVSCMGQWWQNGYPTEVSTPEYLEILYNTVLSHYVFAKHFLTRVMNLKTYTFITGFAATNVMFARMGLLTSAGAALLGLIKALEKEVEEKDLPVRVNELRIGAYIVPTEHVEEKKREHSNTFSHDLIGQYVFRIVTETEERGKTFIFKKEDHLNEMSTHPQPNM